MRTFETLDAAILHQLGICTTTNEILLQTHQVFEGAENAEKFKPKLCKRSKTYFIQKYVHPTTKHESKNQFLVFIY